MTAEQSPQPIADHLPESLDQPSVPSRVRAVLVILIYLFLILFLGAGLRLAGIDWGEHAYLHPDERFLLMVGSDITFPGVDTDRLGAPPTSNSDPWRASYPQLRDCTNWGGYFDTACSPLNPHNRNYSFYVYGTLPMFITRAAVQWVYGHSGLNEMSDLGRPLSAMMDVLTIFLVFLIAERLYRPKVGLLAAAFYAFAVLPIQQSHFFTTDTYINFFTTLTIYFAVRVLTNGDATHRQERPIPVGQQSESLEADVGAMPAPVLPPSFTDYLVSWVRAPQFVFSLLFGVALGCAVASKVSAVPVALMLPLAFGIQLWSLPAKERARRLPEAMAYTALAAVVSFVVFRIGQPYAFTGPGLFGIQINKAWLNNILEQSHLANGADFPPNMQWARRPIWYAFQHLTIWGLGLPLGILAWVGFLWAGVRMVVKRQNGEWRQHLLLWAWTALYFTWQSLQFNPTMRYQYPVYPTLVIFAAWVVFEIGDQKGVSWLRRATALVVGAGVLIATFTYATAFVQSVYRQPVTRLAASRWVYQNVPGPITLHIQTGGGKALNQPLPFSSGAQLVPDAPYSTVFTAHADGWVNSVTLFRLAGTATDQPVADITIRLAPQENNGSTFTATGTPQAEHDARGRSYLFEFSNPLPVTKDKNYTLEIILPPGSEPLRLAGAAVANEGEWDDALPYPLDGYNPYGGLYPNGLGFNMYWDDNPDKLARFLNILEQSDYILISSNRQWGSLPRIPERFPMTTIYYRELMGCPPDKEISWCYRVATAGMFQGRLGFDLVQVFDNSPSLGALRFNDQFADEAFTVYDHPKVLIFKKNASYDQNHVASTLGAVDFSQVVHLTPKEAASYRSKTLLLPADRLQEQQQGGTWSELFSYDALINRFQPLGVVVWYLCVGALGWMVYPLARLALPGLADRGYPLARTIGMLLLTWLVWIAGSARIPFTRPLISAAILLLLLAGLGAAYLQRKALRQEWRERRNVFLAIEALMLAFFVFDLAIRLGNPDLWHPAHGGEKPMDFAYFNAILKSTSFPPYDPWFAGGYLNYYYYGFVFAGVLVKWLGIVPSIAYNLILPTMFMLTALGAFSVAYNLISWQQKRALEGAAAPEEPPGENGNATSSPPVTALSPADDSTCVQPVAVEAAPIPHLAETPTRVDLLRRRLAWLAIFRQASFQGGIAAALGMAVLGNLGTVGMIWRGWQRLVVSEDTLDATRNVLTRLVWGLQGAVQALQGHALPYYVGDWYWNPSRIIPGDTGNPITEFPMFTFLYADPHAHLYALAISLLALAWAVSVVASRGWQMADGDQQRGVDPTQPSFPWQKALQIVLSLFLGSLAIGALWPTNTWDFPTYLALGIVAVAYTLIRHLGVSQKIPADIRPLLKTVAILAGLALLAALTFLLYRPYAYWYGAGYTSLEAWKDGHTPLAAYLAHWGLFLFVIVSWMAWETYDWMASTPLSSLRKLAPYRTLILSGLVLVVGLMLGLTLYFHVSIGWFVILLAAWVLLILLRPNLPDARRSVLFLFGTALFLTLMVELVVLKGDIGRMNTVFKFYLQAWTLLAVSAAAALGWLWPTVKGWANRARITWKVSFFTLVGAAALFTIYGTLAKVENRWGKPIPLTLDGMEYMRHVTYNNWGTDLDLSYDYRAIRWLQENVKGSPVIVEAATDGRQYYWYSRMSIYTGLPTIVGWQWHQEQQRVVMPAGTVAARSQEVRQFYQTGDAAAAKDFLEKYNVRYIIVGALERSFYPGEGLEKFDALEGNLWNEVYREGDMVIYEVVK